MDFDWDPEERKDGNTAKINARFGPDEVECLLNFATPLVLTKLETVKIGREFPVTKKPYPHFETEEQELTWLNAAGTKSAEYMGEPTEEAQREFAQFLTERPDEESTRKPVTVRMKLRDLARLKGLARKLDTKYQTLMLELIAERPARE